MPIEIHVEERTDAQFAYAICPACVQAALLIPDRSIGLVSCCFCFSKKDIPNHKFTEFVVLHGFFFGFLFLEHL
jgi:hypothetical protein